MLGLQTVLLSRMVTPQRLDLLLKLRDARCAPCCHGLFLRSMSSYRGAEAVFGLIQRSLDRVHIRT